ncbi:MAG: hypothetical protein ACREQQ_19175 [Candidatus Binatia bacterium]
MQRPYPRVSGLRWLLLPVVVGITLRAAALGAQVLGGDELHAVRAAIGMPVSEILVTYRLSDHCIPLTAFYRLLMDAGMVLGELALRVPMLASGALLLIMAPAILAPRVGRKAAASFAWLLAISPMLFFYSRIVRSYMPLIVLGFAAVVALENWLSNRSWRYGASYVAVASLAIYFHLAAIPFVLSQLVFTIGCSLSGERKERPGLGSIAVLFGAVALAVAAFLVPAWSSLEPVLAAVQRRSAPGFETVVGVAKLQAGNAHPTLVIAFFAAALAGLVRSLANRSRLAVHTLALALGQVTGLWLLAPLYAEYPLMLNRYLILLLPWLLLWVAIGLAAPWWPGQRSFGSRVQRVAAYAFIALSFATGPLADARLWSSPFAHHNDFLAFYRPRGILPETDIPGFYRSLRDRDVAGPVLEYPFHTFWKFSRALRVYQEFHGREVLVSTPEIDIYDSRLGFRNIVRPETADLLASRARYLAVHLDSGAELARIREAPGLPSAEAPLLNAVSADLESAARELTARLERAWGAPFYSDDEIRVWDLDAVRSRDDESRRRSP